MEGLTLDRHGQFSHSKRTEAEARAQTGECGRTGAMWGPKPMLISSDCIYLLSEIEKEGGKWDCELMRVGTLSLVTTAPQCQTKSPKGTSWRMSH